MSSTDKITVAVSSVNGRINKMIRTYGKLLVPEGYESPLSLMESQRAIKKIKDFFQSELAYGLSLRRVSAPRFVDPASGLNDDLNGVERKVSFDLKDG